MNLGTSLLHLIAGNWEKMVGAAAAIGACVLRMLNVRLAHLNLRKARSEQEVNAVARETYIRARAAMKQVPNACFSEEQLCCFFPEKRVRVNDAMELLRNDGRAERTFTGFWLIS
jgi:hypothetical protein